MDPRIDDLIKAVEALTTKVSSIHTTCEELKEGLNVQTGRINAMQDMEKKRVDRYFDQFKDDSKGGVHPDEEKERPRPTKVDETKNVKLTDLPDFDGTMELDQVHDWVRQLDCFFEFKEYDDVQCFRMAILKLTKYASLWYDNLKAERFKNEMIPLKSWDKLKKEIIKKYVPKDFEHEMYLKLTYLVQGSLSVRDYQREFERLTLLCDLVEKETQKMARFQRGLRRYISNQLDLASFHDFDEMCHIAMKIEKNLAKD